MIIFSKNINFTVIHFPLVLAISFNVFSLCFILFTSLKMIYVEFCNHYWNNNHYLIKTVQETYFTHILFIILMARSRCFKYNLMSWMQCSLQGVGLRESPLNIPPPPPKNCQPASMFPHSKPCHHTNFTGV